MTAIHARLASLPGRRSRALRQALASLDRGPQVTRSELEDRFLALIAQHDLPRPLVNQTIGGHEVEAAGHRVIRITWRQLTERPHEVARLLERLLA